MNSITKIDFIELQNSINQVQATGENGYEKAAMILPPVLLREFHQWQIDTGLIVLNPDGLIDRKASISTLPLSIFTVINFGGDTAKGLNLAFPDYVKHFKAK
jgi:hypothetical protein